jgi:hypothetical protein
LILALSWRASFLILGAASLVWVLFWGVGFRDVAEALPTAPSIPIPWRRLILRMLPVTAVDFCYGCGCSSAGHREIHAPARSP